MKSEAVFGNRRKIRIMFGALAILLALYLGFLALVHIMTEKNDRQVKEVLDGVIYTEDVAATQLEILKPYAEYRFLSVAQRGRLYRAMAELSYMTEEDMVYNHYIACAIFYLQNIGDADSVVYLSNKYIGKLYANGCYASAEKVLDSILKSNDISLFNLDMQASYYLSCADVARMQGKNATVFLSKAEAAIRLMPDSGDKLLNRAKYDLLSARQDIQNGDFDSAEKRISDYSATDHFGLGENQVYVVCDFQIPYYEMTAKIELHRGNNAAAFLNVDQYLKRCDEFQFRAMKLHLLQYVVTHTGESQSEQTDQYRLMEKAVSAENLNQMTNEYGQFLLSDIESTQKGLSASEKEQTNTNNLIIIGMIAIYLTAMLYCVIFILLNNMNRDGLTHLNSRKQYEYIRLVCEKKKIPYCLLMIDIDDFKKVNDTYGHAEGDEVLKKIGAILLEYTGRGIYAYRYGGEEMCLFFLRVPEKRSMEIAQEIREKIAKTVHIDHHYITISGGIGVSVNGENVFQKADQKLYESKKNGKNQIQ